MLDGLSLSAAAQRGQHGHTAILIRNVTSLLVSGGQYEDTTTDIEVRVEHFSVPDSDEGS